MNPDTRAAFEACLSTMRAALRGRFAPPLPGNTLQVARQSDAGSDRCSIFESAALKQGCTVSRATLATWPTRAIEVLRSASAKSVLLDGAGNSRASLDYENARAQLCRAGICVEEDPDDENLFRIDAAITDVRVAIAETGSIVVCSGQHARRAASLVPALHIALVRASQIVGDLCDCFTPGFIQFDEFANVVIITGPSKTADIEGVLVTGVHGPRRVELIIVE